MTLPNKISIFRLFLIPLIVAVWIFPFAQVGIDMPVYNIGLVSISLKNIIVLVLFAHEDEADVGIADHVLDLGGAAGGIEWDGDRANAVCAEVGDEALGLVLREHGHVLLNAHPVFEEGIGQ